MTLGTRAHTAARTAVTETRTFTPALELSFITGQIDRPVAAASVPDRIAQKSARRCWRSAYLGSSATQNVALLRHSLKRSPQTATAGASAVGLELTTAFMLVHPHLSVHRVRLDSSRRFH